MREKVVSVAHDTLLAGHFPPLLLQCPYPLPTPNPPRHLRRLDSRAFGARPRRRRSLDPRAFGARPRRLWRLDPPICAMTDITYFRPCFMQMHEP